MQTSFMTNHIPADTDVFKTSSGRLQKSRCLTTKQDTVTTSGKRHQIYDVLKTSDLRRLEGVQFTRSWRRLIYNVFRTSGLRLPENVYLRHFETSNLERLESVWLTTSSGRLVYNFMNTSDLHRLKDVQFTMS